MRKVLRLVKQQQGTQLLEFILVFPLVWALFIFGMDQFCILYNRQKALAAAYEAGRIACVQPNYGLAKYHGEQMALRELEMAIALREAQVSIQPKGRWEKGNFIQAEVTVTFDLFGSGRSQRVSESYQMVIENAEGEKDESNGDKDSE
jgi:hypothetical protein